MKSTMIDGARQAGALLLDWFGRTTEIRVKESPASIVTDADLASERLLVDLIHRRFPDHGILGEEGGRVRHGAEFTWVLDPLDGTSNFASGLPWFGVMVAVLRGTEPVLACMYLPTEDRCYTAEAGAGAACNERPIRVAAGTDLTHLLCACAMDPSGNEDQVRRQVDFFASLVRHSRNVRATNSLVDFAATADGRLGACVNFRMKVWDIAAPRLILEEAGGLVTDPAGRPIALHLGAAAAERDYAAVAGNPVVARRVLGLLAEAGLSGGLPDRP